MCRPRIFRLRGDSCGWLLCSSTTAFSQQLELVIVFQGAENGPRHILQRQKELRDFYTSVSLPSSRLAMLDLLSNNFVWAGFFLTTINCSKGWSNNDVKLLGWWPWMLVAWGMVLRCCLALATIKGNFQLWFMSMTFWSKGFLSIKSRIILIPPPSTFHPSQIVSNFKREKSDSI